MSAPALHPRPVPLRDAFRTVAGGVTAAGSIVTALVGWGVLTGVQGDALVGLLGLIPGVVAAVTALLAAFGVVRRAEPLVTPVESPAVIVEGSLVPLALPAGPERYQPF